MKNLKSNESQNVNVLSRSEMKNVYGGSESATWCGHTADNQIHQCGLTKEMAMTWEKYCHDNCPTWP
ncbi:MAG TPA: hypothetical protein VHA56_22495 [Mucilaginibacter sp.]|nr:hypothetical protein [Mucilaginibacter sp.]